MDQAKIEAFIAAYQKLSKKHGLMLKAQLSVDPDGPNAGLVRLQLGVFPIEKEK